MKVAQSLYEGVDLGGEGITGLITYMRTDSTRLSDEVVNDARNFIEDKFGAKYKPKARSPSFSYLLQKALPAGRNRERQCIDAG